DARLWLEHGPAIVAAQPVERGELTGRQPQFCDDSNIEGHIACFGWFRGIRGERELFNTPVEWWGILAAMPDCAERGRWARFPSEQQAIEADRRAAIAWARRHASLPPFTPLG